MGGQGHFVEPARPQDTRALLALEHSVFLASDGKLTRRAFSYHMGNTNLLLVARPESYSPEISGYILVFVRKHSARVYSLATSQAFRQQGVAKALLGACFTVLKSRGISHVTLEVRTSNQQAKALYATFGFTVSGTKHNYYGDGEAAVCMRSTVCAPADTATKSPNALTNNAHAIEDDRP